MELTISIIYNVFLFTWSSWRSSVCLGGGGQHEGKLALSLSPAIQPRVQTPFTTLITAEL